MTPIVLTLIQALLLLLLYLFVARAVRAIVRDLRTATAPAPTSSGSAHAPAAPAAQSRDTGARGQPTELVVHSPEGQTRVVSLNSTGDIVLGRGRNTTVALGDSYASDRHARIYRDRGEWLVADLGSTNGTFLNRSRVTRPMRLSPGDQVGIGQTTVEVRS